VLDRPGPLPRNSQIGQAVRSDVERAHAEPAQQPFVPRRRVVVDAQGAQVERDLADRLRAVEQHRHAATVGERADLGDRKDKPALGRHVAERDQPGPAGEQPGQPVDDPYSVPIELDLPHDHAEAVAQVEPGNPAGGVLLVADHDLIARLPAAPPRHDVDPLGDAAGEGDVVRSHAQERGQAPPGVLHLLADPAADRRDVRAVVEQVAIRLDRGVDHPARRGRVAAGVEVDGLGERRHLGPDGSDVHAGQSTGERQFFAVARATRAAARSAARRRG
jgi:hypothetical protein